MDLFNANPGNTTFWCPLRLAIDVRTVKATKTLTHPELFMFVTHALGFGDIKHWGRNRLQFDFQLGFRLGNVICLSHVWTPKYVFLWFIDMHTQQKCCQILHHLGQVFCDRGLDDSWETDTIQYVRAHAAFTWVHHFAFLHTGCIVFPGATLRSFFACPWSPFLTIKIVSLTLDSKGFHRTLERFYRTLPTNVLSNSTDLYRTPKKVP